jgi:hypothetical protein
VRLLLVSFVGVSLGLGGAMVLVGIRPLRGNSATRAKVSFLLGSFVGLLIAGSALGSLIADQHKRPVSGAWLGIGVWIALVSTVQLFLRPGRAVEREHDAAASTESKLPHS